LIAVESRETWPTAQPAQGLVRTNTLDQHLGRRQLENRLGHEGASQRRPVRRRASRKPRPMTDEGLQPDCLDHRDELPVALAKRPKFLFEPGEKMALNSVPVVG